MMPVDSHPQPEPAVEPPPIFGSWRRLYLFVMISQVGVVFLLWLMAEAFR